MNLKDKLELIRFLLRGDDEEAEARGYCAGERGDMRRYLIDHGYLARREGNGHDLHPTPVGEAFLARIERRSRAAAPVRARH